jgi:DedD protein
MRDDGPREVAGTTPVNARRGLLLRAALATGLMLMLGIALLRLDAPRQEAPPVVPAAPEQDASAVPPAVAPGPEAPPPVAPAGPLPAVAEPSPLPADPPADATAASPATPPAPLPAAASAAVAEAPPPAAPETASPQRAGGPPPGPGFMVQLGVFTDGDNAESLRRELARNGYPAHLQSRVVLGPFPDRKSALAAQEKVRRERKLDGMILAPRKH